MSAEGLAVARRFTDALAAAAKAHEIYRTKQTGEFAYARDRRIVLTIREGTIASYEMRFAG